MWIYVLGINAKWWGIVIAGYAHFVLVFFGKRDVRCLRHVEGGRGKFLSCCCLSFSALASAFALAFSSDLSLAILMLCLYS